MYFDLKSMFVKQDKALSAGLDINMFRILQGVIILWKINFLTEKSQTLKKAFLQLLLMLIRIRIPLTSEEFNLKYIFQYV